MTSSSEFRQPRVWYQENHGFVDFNRPSKSVDAENVQYIVANFAGRSYYDLIPVIRSSWAVDLEDAIDIYWNLLEPLLGEVSLEQSNVDVGSFYGDENLDLDQSATGQAFMEPMGRRTAASTEMAMGGVGGTLATLTGSQALRLAQQLSRQLGMTGAALWNRVPDSWKAALAVIGVVDGTIGIDWPFVGEGSITDRTNGNTSMQRYTENLDGNFDRTVARWEANGVWFYKLLDGRMAVQRLDGTWKFWRPKKPIVLYADGASDLKTLLRADKALDRQSKKLRKMLDRRAPRPRRSRQQTQTPSGPQIISLPSGG